MKTSRKRWGGKRAGQTGRPPKWPEGTVRRPAAIPPDVQAAIERVQLSQPGLSWNDALVVLARYAGRHAGHDVEFGMRVTLARELAEASG